MSMTQWYRDGGSLAIPDLRCRTTTWLLAQRLAVLKAHLRRLAALTSVAQKGPAPSLQRPTDADRR